MDAEFRNQIKDAKLAAEKALRIEKVNVITKILMDVAERPDEWGGGEYYLDECYDKVMGLLKNNEIDPF